MQLKARYMPSDQALVRLAMGSYYHYCVNEIAAPLFQYINNFVSILLGPDPAFAHHSCSYVLHSATSSDINARRHAVYSSMNADKKASLLLARRTTSEQFSYNNSTLWAPPCIARVCLCCDLHIEYPLLQPPKSDVQNY
ncbi:hypothetical protein OROHE_002735 [Orobanche hederae]